MNICEVCGGKLKQDGSCPACQGKTKQRKKKLILAVIGSVAAEASWRSPFPTACRPLGIMRSIIAAVSGRIIIHYNS